ncbi:hypothetical protein D3C71_901800 [compost metagenome]
MLDDTVLVAINDDLLFVIRPALTNLQVLVGMRRQPRILLGGNRHWVFSLAVTVMLKNASR